MIDTVGASATARGSRLKFLRQLADIKGEELAELIGVSRQTISYWENAKLSSLSDKNAEKVIQAYNKIGIDCTIEWLLMGIGKMPSNYSAHKQVTNPPGYDLELAGADPTSKEIELFCALHADSITAHVYDNSMQPVLEKGDRVGGVWQPSYQLVNNICIVIIENSIQIRLLKKLYGDNRAILTYLNNDTEKMSTFELTDIYLPRAAKVIRIWRD